MPLWGLEAMTKRAILEQRTNVLTKVHSASFLEDKSAKAALSGVDESLVDINTTFRIDEPLSCVTSCRDPFWEPTISNLGHSYRKWQRYNEAMVCYETALRLCPSNASNYTALGLTKQFLGDTDGAIDLYHRALSITPEDNLSGEMLTRALRESIRKAEMMPMEGEEEERYSFSVAQNTTSGGRFSFGSSVLSGRTVKTPSALSGVRGGRQERPQQGSMDSTDDSNLSFATGASDMDMNNA